MVWYIFKVQSNLVYGIFRMRKSEDQTSNEKDQSTNDVMKIRLLLANKLTIICNSFLMMQIMQTSNFEKVLTMKLSATSIVAHFRVKYASQGK